jgi:2-polyprenyl-3-methyl-5-hydroxy-6-metoxy-1,4-benzoquinol methylase
MKNGNARTALERDCACAALPDESHGAACTRVASRFPELWLRLYAAKKLRSDPVFPAAFELLRASREPLLDVGCGVGLLGFYLRERGFQPPIAGIDRDGRKIARAQAVAERHYPALEFVEQDAADNLERSGSLALFDVLHYLRPDEQERLLARLVPRIAPGGMLLIRDCPRDENARFWLTYLAERFAQATTWNVRTSLHFPTRAAVAAHFLHNEFEQKIAPLWGDTPFNNHLFIFRRRAIAPVAG